MSQRVPQYRRASNGQAFVQHKSIDNKSHRMNLGVYGSPKSREKYRDFLAQLDRLRPKQKMPRLPGDPIVAEIAIAYLAHERTERMQTDGKPTKEFWEISASVQDFVGLHGTKLAYDIDVDWLESLQAELLSRDFVRRYINRRVAKVKAFVRWACSRKLIPSEIFAKLQCVTGIRKGKRQVRESEPIQPVAWEVVEQTLPFLAPNVRAMVQAQWYCGMRPAEVCAMTLGQIEQVGEIWLYRPAVHKGTWLDKDLVKAVPPVAQEVLAPFLNRAADAPLFSPLEAHRWAQEYRMELYRAERKKQYPSDIAKREKKHKAAIRRMEWRAARAFNTQSYDKQISAGLKRAAAAGVEIPHWTPNMLRHGIATLISQTLDEQAAQIWLGHAKLDTTAIYAAKQIKELIAIAQRLHPRRESDPPGGPTPPPAPADGPK